MKVLIYAVVVGGKYIRDKERGNFRRTDKIIRLRAATVNIYRFYKVRLYVAKLQCRQQVLPSAMAGVLPVFIPFIADVFIRRLYFQHML